MRRSSARGAGPRASRRSRSRRSSSSRLTAAGYAVDSSPACGVPVHAHSRTLAHAGVLMLGGGIADKVSMWGAGLLIGAIGHIIDIILDRGHDAEPSAAHAAMADVAADGDLPYEAVTRRSENLQAIGSE